MKKILIMLLLVAAAAHAETYKWIDPDGSVHFTDSLAKVPAEYRKRAEPLGMDANRDSGADTNNASDPNIGKKEQTGEQPGAAPQVEVLKERMMNDEGIMALIHELKDDPEMQAILSDQTIMSAVQAGDIGALMHNPAFLKILDNPKVRQIEKRMTTSGAGKK
jgi:hypothetical protein